MKTVWEELRKLTDKKTFGLHILTYIFNLCKTLKCSLQFFKVYFKACGVLKS